MRTPDRGSTTGAASWTDDEPARRLPAGRAQRVNPPPLTAILKKELVRKYGLFFSLSHLTGGMRTPDRGSTTGAASWTDDEPARRLPAGRAQRVNPPPHRHLKERARTKVRAFFSPKATLEAEESPEKKTGIEFCDLLIALTNSMRSPLCLPEHYARNFSVAL
ncbi:hypothetical protein LFZ55_14615 [Salmonella enterica subsp. diarizonae serovar 65:c:z str. SA20044251]|nr:hypothetical protein LFZ55_14615 [Salmonella enterica subsp. diarizonae serovar 65:c:z str. SA20044251]